MGQRSQMYIDIEVESKPDKLLDVPDNRLAAVYHQWCYGIDAVQRLEGMLDSLSSEIQIYEIGTNNHLRDNYITAEMLKDAQKCSDVNFWRRSIDEHLDLVESHIKYFPDSQLEDIFLNQDNNDGQFYVKVAQDGTLKYAIVTGDDYSKTFDTEEPVMLTPVDPMRYLDDYEVEGYAKSACQNQEEYKQFFDDLNKCIQSIREKAELMTPEELHEMIHEADYSLELQHRGVQIKQKETQTHKKGKENTEKGKREYGD